MRRAMHFLRLPAAERRLTLQAVLTRALVRALLKALSFTPIVVFRA